VDYALAAYLPADEATADRIASATSVRSSFT
jgi:hypothetical protein